MENAQVLPRRFGVGAQRLGVFTEADARAIGEAERRDSRGVKVTREHPSHRSALAVFCIDDLAMTFDDGGHRTNETGTAAGSHTIAMGEQRGPAGHVKIGVEPSRLEMAN